MGGPGSPSTPARLPPRPAASTPARPLKRRRTASSNEVHVLETQEDVHKQQLAPSSGGQPDVGLESQDAEAKARAALEDRRLPRLEYSFAEDYFASPLCGVLRKGLLPLAAKVGGQSAEMVEDEFTPSDAQLDDWVAILGLRFSLLLQGMGSKRSVLAALAKRLQGWHVVQIYGYDANFWLPHCLKALLEQVYPQASADGRSVDGLVASLYAARKAEAKAGGPPLCFVVHSLEVLPKHHQELLARCVACPAGGVHLAASVDSVWAALAWDPQVRRDFCFHHVVVPASGDHEVETKARFPTPPEWSGLSGTRSKVVKDSLPLVLRSLTPTHRELVQAMAEHQEEQQVGVKGISHSNLLHLCQNQLIASTATKLKALLNELRDHSVVVERTAPDGSRLYHLPQDADILKRLAKGQPLGQ